jgi:hypothetical protein
MIAISASDTNSFLVTAFMRSFSLSSVVSSAIQRRVRYVANEGVLIKRRANATRLQNIGVLCVVEFFERRGCRRELTLTRERDERQRSWSRCMPVYRGKMSCRLRLSRKRCVVSSPATMCT